MPGTNPGCLLSSAHLVHSWQMRDGLVSSSTGFRCFSSVKFCGDLRPKVLMAASGPCRTQVFSGVSRFFLMPWGSTNRNKHGAWWCNMVNTMAEGSRDFLYLVCRYIRTRPACLFKGWQEGWMGKSGSFWMTGQSFSMPWSLPCLSRLGQSCTEQNVKDIIWHQTAGSSFRAEVATKSQGL